MEYECLGCPVCYPALAINALAESLGEERLEVADSCPTETVAERDGWPPLPGAYSVLHYRAPVAICTLNDGGLRSEIAGAAPAEVALVGTLHTENLGIERLVLNIIANPHVRFLLLCGSDSRQAIGHLPGQSLLALAREGLDARSRIVGARGKRPVLKNISREVIEHFREAVSVVDLIGGTELRDILAASKRVAGEDPGPAKPVAAMRRLETLLGYLPKRMIPDPAGYFVVYVDRPREVLSLEHYGKDGVLDIVIDGHSAAELYTPAVERGFVTRLDHAAYLGRELSRAEAALRSGGEYVQDGVPERGLEEEAASNTKAAVAACKPREAAARAPMKRPWLAGLLVFACAGALIVWREWQRPPAAAVAASPAAEPPRVVLFADLGEADDDEGCGAIIRGVREAAARGVAVEEIDARRPPGTHRPFG